MNANFEAFAFASLPDLVSHNLLDGQLAKWAFFIETGRLWNIIGLMFAGAVLGRSGFFEREHQDKTKLILYAAGAGATGLVLTAANNHIPALFAEGMPSWIAGQLLAYYINLAIITAGVCLFILLFQFYLSRKALLTLPRRKNDAHLLHRPKFGICTGVLRFWPGGLQHHRPSTKPRAGYRLLDCADVDAWLWLQKFRYGPLEWAWRKLTLAGLKQ